jgi:hypothetical protein
MYRLLNFCLITLIITNVVLALTIVIAPRTSMLFLESFLDNPQNNSIQSSRENELNRPQGEIELIKAPTGTVDSAK